MDRLLENLRNLYQNDIHDKCKIMAYTCDELRHLVLFIHHIISSSNNDRRKSPSIDLDNPFSNMIQDFSNTSAINNRYYASNSVGRGSQFLKTSTMNLPVTSFSRRTIDQKSSGSKVTFYLPFIKCILFVFS